MRRAQVTVALAAALVLACAAVLCRAGPPSPSANIVVLEQAASSSSLRGGAVGAARLVNVSVFDGAVTQLAALPADGTVWGCGAWQSFPCATADPATGRMFTVATRAGASYLATITYAAGKASVAVAQTPLKGKISHMAYARGSVIVIWSTTDIGRALTELAELDPASGSANVHRYFPDLVPTNLFHYFDPAQYLFFVLAGSTPATASQPQLLIADLHEWDTIIAKLPKTPTVASFLAFDGTYLTGLFRDDASNAFELADFNPLSTAAVQNASKLFAPKETLHWSLVAPGSTIGVALMADAATQNDVFVALDLEAKQASQVIALQDSVTTWVAAWWLARSTAPPPASA